MQTVATGLKTVTYSSDLDKKPAVRNEPIKDTQTIKESIKGSHLGKRVRHSEDVPVSTCIHSIRKTVISTNRIL